MKQKIKVLITIDWYLPGTNSGGPVRSIANLVDHLGDIDFYVITRNTDYCEDTVYENVVSDQWNALDQNVSVYYISTANLQQKKIEQLILEIRPDVLYVSGIYSRLFSQVPVDFGKAQGIRTIVAPRGMLSPHALAVKPIKKKAFLLFQNIRSAYHQVEFHVTSGAERFDVDKSIWRFKKKHLLGNLPRLQITENNTFIEKQSGVLKLVSIARIAPEKGTLEGIEALSAIKDGIIELDLFGTRYNVDYWLECENAIKRLPSNITVNYQGVCESDAVAQTLLNYHFLYLPSEGENYGHSIVESFFAGRPVIIRDKTPWKNLEIQKVGFDCELEDLTPIIHRALNMSQLDFTEFCKKTKPYIIKKTKLEDTLNSYTFMFKQT